MAGFGDPEKTLRRLFDAALGAAEPGRAISGHLPDAPAGRLVVVGAGKASAAMAAALERQLSEAGRPLPEGLVVTRYGHAVDCQSVEIMEAAHPEPDAASHEAGKRILALAEPLGEGDLLLALISGGGSALMVAPPRGVTLADKQAVNRALLRSGAAIDEMNVVRKHLSRIKGGRLAAAAYPARTLTLTISDVPGDDPAVIASGPTVADRTTLADAWVILARFGVEVPDSIAMALNDPANETPKPGDKRLSCAETRIVAAPQASLEAAAEAARAAGITPVILGDAIEGEAREVGKVMAGIARQVRRHGQPAPAPCVLLSGGETTVTVRGDGRGGRNVEFLLGLAQELNGEPGVWAIACDTDGVDGAEEVAGAIVGPETPAKAERADRTLDDALARNDGHGFFKALGDQVITGPTLTNVNDFRAIYVP